jgi:hypothetical protein
MIHKQALLSDHRSTEYRSISTLIREQLVDVDGSLHPTFSQLSMHDDRGAVAT